MAHDTKIKLSLSLSLIETTRLEAVEQPSGWSKWSGEAPPWATVGEVSLSLNPGTYRVFSPNGARLYYSPPWEFVREIGDNEIISHDTKTLMLYAGKSSAGLFIISKLA